MTFAQKKISANIEKSWYKRDKVIAKSTQKK